MSRREQASQLPPPRLCQHQHVLVVTTDVLPGYEIRAVLGEVVSSMARTRNPYREGVKNLRGGAYDPKAPENLTRWRTEAVANLGEEARRLGANAVIGMRFDHREVGEMWMELCAYGTAVVIREQPRTPLPDEPLFAADLAHSAEILPGPIGVSEPPSAPDLRSAAETPTPTPET
ncbi:YbjQ family protein [Micromonospora sp. NBC_01699]|nr:YbjQ family protein [Micromonospora sp. NBC_01699]